LISFDPDSVAAALDHAELGEDRIRDGGGVDFVVAECDLSLQVLHPLSALH